MPTAPLGGGHGLPSADEANDQVELVGDAARRVLQALSRAAFAASEGAHALPMLSQKRAGTVQPAQDQPGWYAIASHDDPLPPPSAVFAGTAARSIRRIRRMCEAVPLELSADRTSWLV